MNIYAWKETARGRMEYRPPQAHRRFSLSKETYVALRDYCEENGLRGPNVIRDALRERLRDEGHLEVSE